MELILVRKIFTDKSTIGELFVNGQLFCHTLEDIDRLLDQDFTLEQNKSLKIYANTAIPYGKYKVVISYSPRFKKLMPLLLNVPAFMGIRIHPGNKSEHTEGCLLVGEHKGDPDYIVNSKSTFIKLLSLLTKAAKTEEITIQIKKDDIAPTRIYPEKSFNPWDIF